MRISDEDRRVAGERLAAAVNEGRLTAIDYDGRLGRLYQATTYGDLDPLFADLPYPPQGWTGGYPQPPVPYAITYPQQYPYPQQYLVRNSGAATAGLVFGILGLVGFWVPFVDVLLSVAGVIFSAVGLSQTRGNAMAGHGRAVGGLICGLIGLIPAIVVILVLISAAAFI